MIGLGLMMLALSLVVAVTKPLAQNEGAQALFSSLSGDPLLDVVFAAAFAIIAYSSLAVVLLTSALVASQVIGLDSALPLVLGANIGSGVLAAFMTLKAKPNVRRVPPGNLIFKLVGVALVLPFIKPIIDLVLAQGWSLPLSVVLFHLAFNVALAVIGFALLNPVARLSESLIPTQGNAADSPGEPKYLVRKPSQRRRSHWRTQRAKRCVLVTT
jgi:phosphate:Na+ symporter